jgi:phage-related protein
VVGAFEEAGEIFGNIWSAIQGFAETAGTIIEGIIWDISNAIYAVIRAIGIAIDAINDFLGAKNKLADAKNFKTPPKPPSTPAPKPPGGKIPTFATGVRNFAGGFAIVGERGPELVSLPTGSSVFDRPDTLELLREIGGTKAREYHAHLNVTGLVEAKTEYDVLRQLRRASRMMPFDVRSMETT